ncbi:hypothetical protein K8I61_08750 [bacterium]|nr:hypothetical protein [bacterium]
MGVLVRSAVALAAILIFASVAVAQPTMDLPPEEAPPEVGLDLSKVRIGGYGELHYTNAEKEVAELDLHRFVLYFGYRYDDIWTFHSELEVEHAVTGGDEPGEVEMEQAFVDARFFPELGLSAGVMLIPLGIINQRHEPPTFNGVERPEYHRVIIPTTWWEGGGRLYGDVGHWMSWQVLGTSSFDAMGFSPASGVRGGRQKVAEAKAESMAVTGRVDIHPFTDLNLGLAAFHGGTDQIGGFGWPVTILAGDLTAKALGFELRAEGALVQIPEAEEINDAIADAAAAAAAAEAEGKSAAFADPDALPFKFGEAAAAAAAGGAPGVPESYYGFLAELGFDTLTFFDTTHVLNIFGRYERIDLNASVPDPFEESDALRYSVVTAGLTYKPISNIAFKVDQQWTTTDEKDAEALKAFHAGVGYMF